VSAAGPLARVGELQRRYLSGTFAELCRIESPSGRERRCGERVVAELRALGVEVHEDRAGEAAGSDCGNLLARIPAQAADPHSEAAGAPSGAPGARSEAACARPLLLCAHLDTVPLQAPVEPVLQDGMWENANAGILGADNKAAIAVLLALARQLHAEGSPLELELLFTVCEERSLAGALAFDASQLRSEFGYVFDHASPIGEVVVASPSQFRFEARFDGVAAHAGIRPEEGRSAIVAAARAIASLPAGRIDERSTLNVGTIEGGGALNVVPAHCSFSGELRSLEESAADALLAELVQRIYEAANLPDCDCDVDVSATRTFAGYKLASSNHALAVAEAALRRCGFEPSRVASGGGSDANALRAAGFDCVNLANGTERNHEPGERVSEAALEEMLGVALALVAEAAGE